MQSVSEQVVEEVHQGLESMGLAALSSENTASLVGQLQNIAKKENCVRSVIGEHAHVWAVRMLEGEGPTVDHGQGSRLKPSPFPATGRLWSCERSAQGTLPTQPR